MKHSVTCATHGQQGGFCVCAHTAKELVALVPGAKLIPAPGVEPDIYCTVCRNPYEPFDGWTEERLQVVAGSIVCIECVKIHLARERELGATTQ